MASAHSLRLDAGGQLLRPLMAQSADHRAANSTGCFCRASDVLFAFFGKVCCLSSLGLALQVFLSFAVKTQHECCYTTGKMIASDAFSR